jgi:hypothetical protein
MARDERALAVWLTAEGSKAREQALRVPPAMIDRRGMPLEDLESLRDNLTRLIDATRHVPEQAESPRERTAPETATCISADRHPAPLTASTCNQ